jgi:hypothetical protein
MPSPMSGSLNSIVLPPEAAASDLPAPDLPAEGCPPPDDFAAG